MQHSENMDTKRRLILMASLIVFVIVVILVVWARLTIPIYTPLYDVQQGLTLEGNYTYLAFNVTGVAQTNKDKLGPIYVLSALTNKGYWYRIGVSYNWSDHSGFQTSASRYDGLSENITLWSPLATNGANDTYTLRAYMADNQVVLDVHDLNTKQYTNYSYPAFNATYFVGGPYSNGFANGSVNGYGEFTGLMTEQYADSNFTWIDKPAIYTGIPGNVSMWYSLSYPPSPQASNPEMSMLVLFGCEFNPRCYPIYNSTGFVSQYAESHSLHYENISEYVNRSVFVTGS